MWNEDDKDSDLKLTALAVKGTWLSWWAPQWDALSWQEVESDWPHWPQEEEFAVVYSARLHNSFTLIYTSFTPQLGHSVWPSSQEVHVGLIRTFSVCFAETWPVWHKPCQLQLLLTQAFIMENVVAYVADLIWSLFISDLFVIFVLTLRIADISVKHAKSPLWLQAKSWCTYTFVLMPSSFPSGTFEPQEHWVIRVSSCRLSLFLPEPNSTV